jgi:hypothetical protein
VQKLYLSRCKIREIDKTAFAELGNMIELDLSFNQITNLQPATFKGLNRLRKLVLRGNPLGKLNQFQFPNLRNLVNVDLAECRLAYVDPQAFVYLKAVEVISLRGQCNTVMEKRSPVFSEVCRHYPPITYYWTVPLILDHSYLVGKLTSSKTADTKV